MKNLIFAILTSVMALMLFSSCVKEVPERALVNLEGADIISFGFYKADNEGKIINDYVISELKDGESIIALPAEVEKESLVARFELPQGATVTINGTPQVSGTTSNNFTVPLDYIVSNGGANKKFTIVVDKAPDAVWSRLATLPYDNAVEMSMAINPTTKLPGIAYKVDRSSSSDEKIAMVEFDGEQWIQLGEKDGFSEGRVANISMAYNSAGEPYVVYGDYMASTSQQASVMKYNGAWSYVGDKGITPFVAYYNALTIYNDKPWFFSMNNTTGVDKRALIITEYSTGSWITNQKIDGRPAPGGSPMGTNSYYPSVKVANGSIYLYVLNAGGTQSFSIYKYSNGSWSTIAEQYLSPGATNSYITRADLEVDKNDNVYVKIVDNSTGSYRMKVLKYSADSGEWSTVGDLIATNEYKKSADLAISPLGTLYLAYHNDSKQPVMIYLDKETKNWSRPIVIDEGESSDLAFEFTNDGTGYASYISGDKSIVALKYDTQNK